MRTYAMVSLQKHCTQKQHHGLLCVGEWARHEHSMRPAARKKEERGGGGQVQRTAERNEQRVCNKVARCMHLESENMRWYGLVIRRSRVRSGAAYHKQE